MIIRFCFGEPFSFSKIDLVSLILLCSVCGIGFCGVGKSYPTDCGTPNSNLNNFSFESFTTGSNIPNAEVINTSFLSYSS